MLTLRDYQQSIFDQITASSTDDVVQLATGGGKSAIIGKLNLTKPTINIAHRNMLVEQLSTTLSIFGVDHQIIGNAQTVRRCQLTQRKYGVEYGGNHWVGTIQSISSLHKSGKLDIDRVNSVNVVIDECHHVADGNMWALVKDIFPNARFIGFTATPCRLDGRGLHKECGGLYETLIQAEQLKTNDVSWLIANNYLADYQCWTVPILDFSALKRGVNDYNLQSLCSSISRKEIAGEVFEHWFKLAKDKQTIVYSPSIENAQHIAKEFKKRGVSSTYIASSLSLVENTHRLDAFRKNDVTVLVNVEMATEGLDVPDAACVVMLRPTVSFVLYKQMIGRGLRKKTDGSKAILIDHVGNILKHGLPDDEVEWTLFGQPKNHKTHLINCDSCHQLHNPYLKNCPHCGKENWLRDKNAALSALVEQNIIDVELVKRVRAQINKEKHDELRAKALFEQELRLKTTIVVPNWKYGDDLIGRTISKLKDWFILNLADSGLSIAEINRFTTGPEPRKAWWTQNFTVQDLKASNHIKARRVYDKWVSK